MVIDIPKFEISDDIIINESTNILLESNSDTHILRDEIYPLVEKALSNPSKDRAFKNLIGKFVNKHSVQLNMAGPVELVPFTDIEKAEFFSLLEIDQRAVIENIKKMTKLVNDKANWKLIQQNPIFTVFYMCIRYYQIHKDIKGVDTTLLMYSLASYPSVFSVFFKYGAKEEVMKYTIDNLTGKYMIKQQGSVIKTLIFSITGSYNFMKPFFVDASDKEIIRFVGRIRNDQKSLFKNIANEYYDNEKKGLKVLTQSEEYADGQVIDDTQNDTTVVENITQKVLLSMIANGVDITRATISAKVSQVSISDLRLYLSKIVIDEKSVELKRFIEAVLFIYLYDEHHERREINEKKFLSFSMDLFRRTNSNNVNVGTIKGLLDKWSIDSGVTGKFKRLASQVGYKKGIFMYIIFCIQYYN